MADVTYQQADEAAQKLAGELGDAPWLRGVGVEPDPAEGFVVTLRAQQGAELPELPELPDRVLGATVKVSRRGMAAAR